MKEKPAQLGIKISGNGVTPKTVDSLLLLRLAETCLRLTIRLADASSIGLTFSGVSVKGGSAAIALTPSDPASAKLVATRALRLISNDEPAPYDMKGAIDDVRSSLRALPRTQKASFVVGEWSGALTAPTLEVTEDAPWERTELRVRPIRIGGTAAAGPSARLVSESEAQAFNVSVSQDDARALGSALYREIDVELELCRDAHGNIEQGRVTSVTRLSEEEPLAAWRAWFETNAGDWEDVDDVGEALGRH